MAQSSSSAYHAFSTMGYSPARGGLLSLSLPTTATTPNMSTMTMTSPPFPCEFNLPNSPLNTPLSFTISVTSDSGDEVLALNIVPPSPTLDPTMVNDDLGSQMEALSLSEGTTATHSSYPAQRLGGGYSTQCH